MQKKGLTTTQAITVIMVFLVMGSFALYWFIKPPPSTEKLRIAVVMWGHHDEGLWDPAAANAVLRLRDKYNLQINWVEEIDLTKIESTVRALAPVSDVIYLTTDEYEEACKKVAPQYPNVYWIQQYESRSLSAQYFPENVVAFNAYKANELSFLAGAIAARITKTQKLGVIQAIDGPRDTRLMSAAFRAGAKYVNPNIEVRRVVMNAYVAPLETRQAVASFAEAGVDIVFVGMDDESGTLEAKARGIYAIQEYLDITASYPNTLIGCTSWVWDVWLDRVLDAIVKKQFSQFRETHYQMPLSLSDKSLDIPVFGNMVSAEVQVFAASLRAQIISGSVVVPIIDQW